MAKSKKTFAYGNSIARGSLWAILVLLIAAAPLRAQKADSTSTPAEATVPKSQSQGEARGSTFTGTDKTPGSATQESKPENEAFLIDTEEATTSLPQAVTPDGKGNLTFTPGVRMQVRYEYNKVDKNNDFFIRRLRMKGKGSIYGIATYNFEVKIDNTGRFNQRPFAQLEHAWITFPLVENLFTIRAGLEDDVFSRNALTSDSKLLLMDRSLIKEELTALGITDNTIGVLAYGRPFDGHLTYSAGIFDNLGFNLASDPTAVARKSQGAMAVGRLAYDFLDPANPGGSYDDYQASLIGQGQKLTVGVNVANLHKAEIGPDELSIFAWGADIFLGTGPLSLEAEYNAFEEKFRADGMPQIDGNGWYAQGGILVHPKVEIAIRHQQIEPDKNVAGDQLNWTSVGLNYYIRGHAFKMQADYTFKDEQGVEIDNDVLRVQLQLSF